jgi:hypothetical protein
MICNVRRTFNCTVAYCKHTSQHLIKIMKILSRRRCLLPPPPPLPPLLLLLLLLHHAACLTTAP